MSWRKVAAILVALALAGAGSMALAAAQGVSDDSACPLEPLTLPLWDATPAAIIAATPVMGQAEVDPAAIEAAVTVIVTCINTGEPVYIYAIYTDRYLAEQYADQTATYLPAFEQALDRNELQPENQFTLQGMGDVTPLNDGRVSVTIALSNGITTFQDTVTLASQDGIWLIDDVTNLDPPV